MARQYWRGCAMIAPVPPALVTCKSGEKINVLTVAWTGILSTVPPKTYISVRPSRFSHAIIAESRRFVINLPPVPLAKQVDFCGMYTGAKTDKISRCGFTVIPSKSVDVPTISECPIALECQVTDTVHLGSHDMFIADIVAVSVDDSLLDRSGKLVIERANLLAYAHGDYFALGQKVGFFGFSALKRNSMKKKNAAKRNAEKVKYAEKTDKNNKPEASEVPKEKHGNQ